MTVIHWVLVDVMVSIGAHALHVSESEPVTTAGVLEGSHSLQVCGSVLVVTAGVLLLSHSLHVCAPSVLLLDASTVVLVLAEEVLLDEAHSLHV